MNGPLGDHIKIFPEPLRLAESEYQKLKAGVHQRVRALQHFFRDLAFGEPKIEMPLKQLLADRNQTLENIRDMWAHSTREEIRFVYGPDLIKNAEGEWLVIEDNIGVIGGMSEVPNDLKIAVQLFLKETGVAIDKVLGLLPYDDQAPGHKVFELDSTRKKAILDSLGIRSCVVDQIGDADKEKLLKGEIKALINFSSTKWKPKRQFTHHIFKENRVAMLESPGIKPIASKGFLPFVPAMITHYLKEDPILGCPRTEILNEPKIPFDGNWVLKRASAMEGDGVLVFPKVSDQQILQDWMSTEGPGSVVVKQEYVAPSTHLGHRVEIRPIAYAYGFEKIYVGENFMAKAMPPGGDARNCLTRGAYLLPVTRENIL